MGVTLANENRRSRATLKLAQQKTFDLFSASLRYDMLKFTDERVKWYQEDVRVDNETLLAERYSHQLTATHPI